LSKYDLMAAVDMGFDHMKNQKHDLPSHTEANQRLHRTASQRRNCRRGMGEFRHQ
jgi:hypothetical protein